MNGEEVDFVIEQGRTLVAVGVKATAPRGPTEAVTGAPALHTGDETFWLDEGILAVPWWRVL